MTRGSRKTVEKSRPDFYLLEFLLLFKIIKTETIMRKKYALGLLMIILCAAVFAFTNKKNADSKDLTTVYYRFDGTNSQFEDETKWVEIADPGTLSCVGTGNACWMEYTDQAGPNPPTLPSGFSPYTVNHGKKGN